MTHVGDDGTRLSGRNRPCLLTGPSRSSPEPTVASAAKSRASSPGHGFAVVLGSRDPGRGEQAARHLDPAGQAVVACVLDVASASSVEAMADWVGERFGRADVLVNNAAIHYDTGQRAESADRDVVQEALQTNLLGAWRTTQALLPLLRRSPHAARRRG